jgi:hypothetical protein
LICLHLAPDRMSVDVQGQSCVEGRGGRGMKNVGTMRSHDVSDKQKLRQRQKVRKRRRTRSEQEIDESLEESFPASDPPSWMPLRHIGSPR